MICKKCGKDNPSASAFCVYCGNALLEDSAAQPAGPEQTIQAKTKKKKNVPALVLGILSVVLAVLLALSFLGIFAGGTAVSTGTASKSFSTPEDAIEYFVGCIKNSDLNGALGACAVNEMAEGFDFEEYTQRLRVIQPFITSYLPSEYGEYADYNRYKVSQQIAMQAMNFVMALSIPEDYTGLVEGTVIPIDEDDSTPKDIIKAIDPSDISGLEIIDIGKAEKHDSERNRENQQRLAKCFGADDLQFRTVLYKYDGDYYVGGFTVIEYNGKWLIDNLSDPLAGIPAYGTPIELDDKSEYYDDYVEDSE